MKTCNYAVIYATSRTSLGYRSILYVWYTLFISYNIFYALKG